MSLTSFKPFFDNAYEEIFQKVIVSKMIANTRFESVLTYGTSVERVSYDISGVQVRDVVRGSDSVIDTITDTNELLTVNIEKEAVFYISDGEVKQAGPLNPGEVIGGQIAIKVGIALDARVFAEVVNAKYTFDNGDLTTTAATGTPITLSSTTVPQMVTRAPAKLRRLNNQNIVSNMAMVVDSYAAADMAQYLLGKNIDLAASVYKNGYTDVVSNAEMYVSENLTGQADFLIPQTPTDGDTITIGGVVFRASTAIGTTPGNVLISGSAASFATNLKNLINAPSTTTALGVALSAADAATISLTLKLLASNPITTTVRIVGTGSGRLVLATSLTNTNNLLSVNFIHAYFGKKGAIDLVVQDLSEVDMRKTSTKRGTNVFSSLLAGVKTFKDGAQKFLDLWIAA